VSLYTLPNTRTLAQTAHTEAHRGVWLSTRSPQHSTSTHQQTKEEGTQGRPPLTLDCEVWRLLVLLVPRRRPEQNIGVTEQNRGVTGAEQAATLQRNPVPRSHDSWELKKRTPPRKGSKRARRHPQAVWSCRMAASTPGKQLLFAGRAKRPRRQTDRQRFVAAPLTPGCEVWCQLRGCRRFQPSI
jgi:hypothetical protein